MTEYNDSFQRHMLREMKQQTALLQIAVNLLSDQKKSYEREIHAGGETLRTTATTKESGNFAEEVDKGFEQMKKFSKDAAALVASGALDDLVAKDGSLKSALCGNHSNPPEFKDSDFAAVNGKPVKPEIKVGQEWKCRDGGTTIIASYMPGSKRPWMDHYGRTYTNDGAWSINGKTWRDLVELIEDAPEQQENTLEQHAQECANKIKQALDDMHKATGKPIGVISVEWIKYDNGEYFLKDVSVKVPV